MTKLLDRLNALCDTTDDDNNLGPLLFACIIAIVIAGIVSLIVGVP